MSCACLVSLSLVLPLFLLVLALLLGLSLRPLLVSFFAMFSPVPLRPPLLLLPPLRLLLLVFPRLVLIACVGSRLRERLRGMLLFPPSLQRLRGLQLLSLPLSISLMSSFLLLKVLVWVLWWQLVLWFRCFLAVVVLFVPCLSVLLQLGVSALRVGGGGGGVLTLLRLCCSCVSFVEGVRVWLLTPSGLLVRQISYRAMSLGLKVVIRRGSRLHLPCFVLCGLGALRDSQLVRAVLDSTGGSSWT